MVVVASLRVPMQSSWQRSGCLTHHSPGRRSTARGHTRERNDGAGSDGDDKCHVRTVVTSHWAMLLVLQRGRTWEPMGVRLGCQVETRAATGHPPSALPGSRSLRSWTTPVQHGCACTPSCILSPQTRAGCPKDAAQRESNACTRAAVSSWCTLHSGIGWCHDLT